MHRQKVERQICGCYRQSWSCCYYCLYMCSAMLALLPTLQSSVLKSLHYFFMQLEMTRYSSSYLYYMYFNSHLLTFVICYSGNIILRFDTKLFWCHPATFSKSFTHTCFCWPSSINWHWWRAVTVWSWAGNCGPGNSAFHPFGSVNE